MADAADLEELSVLLCVKLLSVLIDTLDVKSASKCNDGLVWVDFIASQIVVSDETEARLINVVFEWKLLSS